MHESLLMVKSHTCNKKLADKLSEIVYLMQKRDLTVIPSTSGRISGYWRTARPKTSFVYRRSTRVIQFVDFVISITGGFREHTYQSPISLAQNRYTPRVSRFSRVLRIQTTLFAQSAGSGTIVGIVKDPANAVVSAATITVHNADTGGDRTVETNDSGAYSAAFLAPGPYEITVSKAGFSKILRKDLTLQVGQVMTVDFALQVQAGSETVTVSGEAPIVDPSKTDVSQVVSTEFVDNLPIAGRRWENFVLLTPNATTDGGSGLISYRGISGLYNSTAVDGANNNQALMSETRGRATGIPYIYSQDSIQEFQVNSAVYSAEPWGQAAGGITNAVTRSGLT